MQWNAEKADLMDKGGSSSTSEEDPFFPAFSDFIRVHVFWFSGLFTFCQDSSRKRLTGDETCQRLVKHGISGQRFSQAKFGRFKGFNDGHPSGGQFKPIAGTYQIIGAIAGCEPYRSGHAVQLQTILSAIQPDQFTFCETTFHDDTLQVLDTVTLRLSR